MASPSLVSSFRFVPAHTGDGLLGWVSFATPGGILIGGIALRRSRDGQLVFSWPGKRERSGRVRHHARPMDDDARRAVEGELLAHLRPWIEGQVA